MTISLRDYDFTRAEAIVRAAVDRDAGTSYGWDVTRMLRELNGAAHALVVMDVRVLAALRMLAVDEGGLRLNARWPAEHPLVRILRRLRSHPAWQRRSTTDDVRMADEVAATNAPLSWSVRGAIGDVVAGIKQFIGAVDVPADGQPWQLRRSTRVYEWTQVFCDLISLDEFGAFSPSFTRGDALAGDVWLLQPVSPRLVLHEVAHKLGLELLGFLPAKAVDVAGRVVMVCIDRVPASHDQRVRMLEDSKWIAGWKHTRWQRGKRPVSEPGFDLVTQLDVPEHDTSGPDRYGSYRHSSELPAFPPARMPWEG
jgi:hypothetical protein